MKEVAERFDYPRRNFPRSFRSGFFRLFPGFFPAVWLVFFFFFPLALMGAISFAQQRDLIHLDYVWSMDAYARSMEPMYAGIFVKSLWYAALTTVLCFSIGFPVSVWIVFAPAVWKPFLLLVVVLPFWTNMLIRTYALIAILRHQGYLNDGLELMWEALAWFAGFFAFDIGSFARPRLLYNNFSVLFGLVYVHLPFMILPLYAALERMDRRYVEASLDLGASQWQSFRYIVIPLCKPGIASGVLLCFVPAIGSFLIPDLLGGTESQMIANVIERQFKSADDWPLGAAFSLLLVYLTFFVLVVHKVFAKKSVVDVG